ncbi:hypothetical protein D8674_000156 [Pyrus ussuriensis x Pyrus communis]|uniref:Uncharacterized protein n=1 Tax=Pyrus ussuriensis x Pyrus communis TaxID=2448454 RepID=A0A5N5F2J2_9ROSA|nr:hypothetical protein D8674_000156 [Pyrus ussuriensis x Pyrus communis]
MSGSKGFSDEGFSSFGSRFEPSRTSLESYEKEVLGDSHDHQVCLPLDEEAGEEHRSRDRALDIVASTSHVSVVEEGARKHRVRPVPRPKSQEVVLKIVASKKDEVRAIEWAVAKIAGELKRLMPFPPNIDPIFPLIMEHVVQLKDQTLERLKRRNDENLRLKKHLEPTILKASKVREDSDEEFEDGAKANDQTQQGEDRLGDAEDGDGGETQHDVIKSLASDEDDS